MMVHTLVSIGIGTVCNLVTVEYLRFAFGIYHSDEQGGLRTLGKKLAAAQIDDVRARYQLAKERLEALGLAE